MPLEGIMSFRNQRMTNLQCNMTSKQIQDAAEQAAWNLGRTYWLRGSHRFDHAAQEIAAVFLPFAEDKPVEPLEIKQTSVPLNKV